MTSFNWLRRNSNHDYCKKKPKVTGILRNYSIPAVINNLEATIVLATAAAAVEAALISDATSALTRGEQSAADGRPDGDDILHGNRHAVNMGSPIKLKPKTLILRCQTRY